MKNYMINIPSSFCINESTTGLDIAVYGFLSMATYNVLIPMQYVHANGISCYIYGKKYNTALVAESLHKIINISGIKGSSISWHEIMVDSNTIRHMSSKYISIKSETFNKIVSSSYTYKFELLKYLCLIIASRNMNERTKYNHLYVTEKPLDYYSEKMGGISHSTVIKYQTSLENMGIIYVRKSFMKHNMIGLYEDRNYIEGYARLFNYKNPHPSNARSLMRKYLWMAKGKKYPPDETEEVLNYIKEYNSRMEKGGYLEKVKDLSIFNLT